MTGGMKMEPNRPLMMPKDEENVSILRYINILIRRRWLIILGTLGVCVLAIVYAKLQTPVYEAAAVFLPARSQDMSSRIDASFGVGQGAAGTGAADIQFLIEYYNQILQSRRFLESVARKPFPEAEGSRSASLYEFYGPKAETEGSKIESVLETMRESLRVTAPKPTAGRATSTVMTVTYAASEPNVAAAAANLFLDELVLFSQSEQNSKTKNNREFIENQLKETRRLLTEAEMASSTFDKRNRKIATPELQVEQDRLKRAVKLQEEIYITLNKQLELAKIQEQENKETITVIQRAVPPRERSKPKIKKTAMMAGLLGLAVFCVLAWGLDYSKRMKHDDPDTKEFLEALAEVKGDVTKVGRIFRGRKPAPTPKK